MKFIIKILLILVCVSSVYALDTVDLNQSIDIAMHNSPVAKAYREQLIQAKHTINLAQAYYNPTVAASLNYTALGPKREKTTTVFDPTDIWSIIKYLLGKGDTITAITSPGETSNGNVTVTLPIEIGGTFAVYIQGSKSLYKSAEIGVNTTVLDIIKNVKIAYLSCLLYNENIITAKSAYQLSDDYLNQIKLEVEEGVKAKFDITRQEFDVSTRKNAVIEAEGNYNQMVNAFNQVLGKEDNFVVPQTLNDLNIANAEIVENDELIKIAYENRPELKQAMQDLNTANIAVLKEKKVNNPTLTLAGNVNHLFINQLETDKDTWSAAATLSVPIFDGGIQRHNTKIAESKAEQQKAQIESIKQAIVSNVLNSKVACVTAKSQIATCESSVKLAQEAYDISKVRYEENLGTYLDVSSALDSLVAAKNALSVAKYSYAIALVDLERQIATTLKVDDYSKEIINSADPKPVKIKKSSKGDKK